jgi:hypothetical protein
MKILAARGTEMRVLGPSRLAQPLVMDREIAGVTFGDVRTHVLPHGTDAAEESPQKRVQSLW